MLYLRKSMIWYKTTWREFGDTHVWAKQIREYMHQNRRDTLFRERGILPQHLTSWYWLQLQEKEYSVTEVTRSVLKKLIFKWYRSWSVNNHAIAYKVVIGLLLDMIFSSHSWHSALGYEAWTWPHPNQHMLLLDGVISQFLLHSHVDHEVSASCQK